MRARVVGSVGAGCQGGTAVWPEPVARVREESDAVRSRGPSWYRYVPVVSRRGSRGRHSVSRARLSAAGVGRGEARGSSPVLSRVLGGQQSQLSLACLVVGSRRFTLARGARRGLPPSDLGSRGMRMEPRSGAPSRHGARALRTEIRRVAPADHGSRALRIETRRLAPSKPGPRALRVERPGTWVRTIIGLACLRFEIWRVGGRPRIIELAFCGGIKRVAPSVQGARALRFGIRRGALGGYGSPALACELRAGS